MRSLTTFIISVLGCLAAYALDVTSGVSRELAVLRKKTLSNIIYNLTIDVSSAENAIGELELYFDYLPDSTDGGVQLDFTGEAISYIVVNGSELPLETWHSEHIFIDSDKLIEGQNCAKIGFTSAERALNRNPEYLYTLFVPNRAHSVFPCFDQPDLKATYNLTLTMPEQWCAVSNSPIVSDSNSFGKRTVTFGPTEPLSTYLFAFAAGEFDYRQHTNNGRTIGAYYRESDPDRLSQLDAIFEQVHSSLDQLEEYTGIPYPFAKYDLVILPGFQFGGMEHTGATFYNDNVLFLGKNATASDMLKRATVIAHETSHMWFGDYVTMEWFDDVWTKEVFANYFAAQLTRRLLPEFDHDVEWLRVYMASAIDQDITDGTTPIKQQLDNLKDAGLIYNNIIYNKSPLMIDKLAKIAGNDNFRRGIRKYLSDNAYGNATWDDVVISLQEFSDADLENFSRVWVYEKGMPQIKFDFADGLLTVSQSDPYGRQLIWPQSFKTLVYDGKRFEIFDVVFDGSADSIKLKAQNITTADIIIPSLDGGAYGLLTVDSAILTRLLSDFWSPDGILSQLPPVGRLATLLMLNENYFVNNISTPEWLDFLICGMSQTTDSQTLSLLASYLAEALLDYPADGVAPYESKVTALVNDSSSQQGKLLALRALISTARNDQTLSYLYDLWDAGESPLLDINDYCDLALELAIAMPDRSNEILERQRARIKDNDRLRKFDFLSRAAVSDSDTLDALFESLNNPANRQIEPWTRTLLSMLNHHSRHSHSTKYIDASLRMLPDIQVTGDIFFPAAWSASLLNSYRSKEAARCVENFLNENDEMNPLLLNKVKQCASRLMHKQL